MCSLSCRRSVFRKLELDASLALLPPMLSRALLLPLRLLFPASIPSHCMLDVVFAGVPDRLRLPDLLRPPMLDRAREPFPESPSNLRSASAVASSFIPCQPSCVPRKSEWPTFADACDDASREDGRPDVFVEDASRDDGRREAFVADGFIA